MSDVDAPTRGGAATAVVAPPRGGPSRRRSPRRSKAELAWAALFVLPLFSGVVIFYLWPVVRNAYLSFTTFGAFSAEKFTGLKNYQNLFVDPMLWRSMLNTFIYVGMMLLGIPLALIVASLLNRPGLKYVTAYRTAFFLPYVAMPAAISMVWRVIFNGDFGVLNYGLSLIGVRGPNWLSTEWFALMAVGIVGVWIALGFNLIILSAGIKGIPPEMYEASAIDGATGFRQFFSITLPLLSPSIFFVSVMTVIGGFQLFDLLYALMGTSNPQINNTQSLVYLFFANFQTGDKGYAAAVGVIIMFLVAAFTVMQFRLQKKWVTYA